MAAGCAATTAGASHAAEAAGGVVGASRPSGAGDGGAEAQDLANAAGEAGESICPSRSGSGSEGAFDPLDGEREYGCPLTSSRPSSFASFARSMSFRILAVKLVSISLSGDGERVGDDHGGDAKAGGDGDGDRRGSGVAAGGAVQGFGERGRGRTLRGCCKPSGSALATGPTGRGGANGGRGTGRGKTRRGGALASTAAWTRAGGGGKIGGCCVRARVTGRDAPSASGTGRKSAAFGTNSFAPGRPNTMDGRALPINCSAACGFPTLQSTPLAADRGAAFGAGQMLAGIGGSAGEAARASSAPKPGAQKGAPEGRGAAMASARRQP